MNIRPAEPGDHEAIFAVHADCFPTTAEARLVDLLRAAGRLIVSLVAEEGETIVGHVAFSPVTTESGAVGVGLAPVAVLASHRRRGIAAELIRQSLTACQTAGYTWAVVLGEPSYYARFSFQPAMRHGLSDEYGGGDYFQALELVAGQMPTAGGVVKYSPEFNEFAW
ncbi:MAG TPA: N-acetyltransferase [Pirellulaceae bacterium]|jgi:putative acetyltransferase